MKLGLGIKNKIKKWNYKVKRIGSNIIRPYDVYKSKKETKIFCIGLNKTGTTSLEKAMKDFGFKAGDQREAELLFKDWVKRDFSKLIKYCKSAVFFQDSPFSHPHTFSAMDQAFPGSKFILTIRNSSDQWYNSVIKYEGKLWGNGNIPPTAENLKNATYIYKGNPFYIRKHLNDVKDNDLYNKQVLTDYYNAHNKNVIDYFRFRKDDLLILNVAEENAFKKLVNFLNVKTNETAFPWKNKTNEK